MVRLALAVALSAIACGPARGPAPPGAATQPQGPALAASDIEQMAMSSSGSCGVFRGGRAHCWGDWNDALVKLGLAADAMTDIAELRIGHDVLAEQHEVDHLCARDAQHRVRCWGNGHQGQLGPIHGDDTATPVTIEQLPPAAQLALGDHHTCALTTAGQVLCWGSNERGQLGLGRRAEIIRAPTRVELPAKVTQIAASHFTTCALTDDHQVYCWGENLRGEAGPPSPPTWNAWTPYHVAFAQGASQISGAFSTLCAVKRDGQITCWGYLTDKLGPAFGTAVQGEVPDIQDATTVAVGYSHACAIRSDATLWCWGTGDRGALGDGRGIDAWRPRQVHLPGRATQVVTGVRNGCARLEDRRWYCWGDNAHGAIASRGEPPLLAPALLDLSRVE